MMKYDNQKTFDENFPSASTAIVVVGILVILAVIFGAVFGI